MHGTHKFMGVSIGCSLTCIHVVCIGKPDVKSRFNYKTTARVKGEPSTSMDITTLPS